MGKREIYRELKENPKNVRFETALEGNRELQSFGGIGQWQATLPQITLWMFFIAKKMRAI